jgi:multicomponent Na+:H+ antiporter subunit F
MTEEWVPIIGIGLVSLGILAAILRTVRGPTSADRVVAAELVFIATVCAILLAEMLLDEPLLIDVALVAVLVGFLATIGLSRLVRTRDEADS